MIPVSTLYDEYIEQRKLTEQKKPVEYIVPPPSRGVGTIKSKVLHKFYEIAYKSINFWLQTGMCDVFFIKMRDIPFDFSSI